MTRFCFLAALTLALSFTLTEAADWPRFRGPNGTGVAEGTMPEIDPAKPLWKTTIPGRGNSSPIVVKGKVYLQSASTDGKKRLLICIDAASGKTDWTKELGGDKGTTHKKNSLASGTPACDGKTLYCQWWDGSGVSLHAYDLTGKELWHTSLGSYESQHGPGFSPVIHDGLVFVNVDDDKHAELVALDAESGSKKWTVDRKHFRASYATPFLLEQPGKPAELILGTTTAVTSYDPKTGKVNWNYDITWPKERMPLRVVGSPVFAAGLFIVYCGDGSGARYMIAVDPSGKKPTKSWELNRDTPYVPCVLVKDDRLFWITDKGIATTAAAKTGKTVWAEKVFETADVSASPVMVGDQVLMVSESGEVATLKLAPKFEFPAMTKLKLDARERVYATPAVADGRVFIRSETSLFCFGKK